MSLLYSDVFEIRDSPEGPRCYPRLALSLLAITCELLAVLTIISSYNLESEELFKDLVEFVKITKILSRPGGSVNTFSPSLSRIISRITSKLDVKFLFYSKKDTA